MPTADLKPGWLKTQAGELAHSELVAAWVEMEHAVNAVVTALPERMTQASAELETARRRMRSAVKSFTFWQQDN